MKKIYTSKLGLKFAIDPIQKPCADDVVFFTPNEYEWIRQQNLSSDEFKALWMLKRDDFRYNPIPVKDETEAARLARVYGDVIIERLKGNNNKEKE
jgi:hypothetical protein